jgi:hypothetical protein
MSKLFLDVARMLFFGPRQSAITVTRIFAAFFGNITESIIKLNEILLIFIANFVLFCLIDSDLAGIFRKLESEVMVKMVDFYYDNAGGEYQGVFYF